MNSSSLHRVFAISMLATFVVSSARAQDKDDEKLGKRAERAAQVLTELVSLPDKSPPKSLLNSATCIAVVPGVVQAGLGVGGRFGFGVASCRTGSGWSTPVFVGLKGGSFGFQIGGQSADVVLVFVNKDAQRLASSTFDIGAGASIPAGPGCRHPFAAATHKADAPALSFSETQGV